MKCLRLMTGLVCLAATAGCYELDQSQLDAEMAADSGERAAMAGPPIVHGGGRAVVTNEEGFLPPGVVTEFGVNAWIHSSGEAMGQFTCFVEPGGGGPVRGRFLSVEDRAAVELDFEG